MSEFTQNDILRIANLAVRYLENECEKLYTEVLTLRKDVEILKADTLPITAVNEIETLKTTICLLNTRIRLLKSEQGMTSAKWEVVDKYTDYNTQVPPLDLIKAITGLDLIETRVLWDTHVAELDGASIDTRFGTME